tara:strand:+ start:18922 stop:19326 length:405 start_codon:yes stop_codon:yes gene_type:complete
MKNKFSSIELEFYLDKFVYYTNQVVRTFHAEGFDVERDLITVDKKQGRVYWRLIKGLISRNPEPFGYVRKKDGAVFRSVSGVPFTRGKYSVRGHITEGDYGVSCATPWGIKTFDDPLARNIQWKRKKWLMKVRK